MNALDLIVEVIAEIRFHQQWRRGQTHKKPPSWALQPEHIKNVFRKFAISGDMPPSQKWLYERDLVYPNGTTEIEKFALSGVSVGAHVAVTPEHRCGMYAGRIGVVLAIHEFTTDSDAFDDNDRQYRFAKPSTCVDVKMDYLGGGFHCFYSANDLHVIEAKEVL